VVDEDTNFVTEPALVGLPAMAPVREDEYQGRINNKVDMLLPVDGPKKADSAPMKKTGSPAPQARKKIVS
jgi:hypothetical protein